MSRPAELLSASQVGLCSVELGNMMAGMVLVLPVSENKVLKKIYGHKR